MYVLYKYRVLGGYEVVWLVIEKRINLVIIVIRWICVCVNISIYIGILYVNCFDINIFLVKVY